MIEIAKRIHPNPSALTQGALKMHARNIAQVMGYQLNTPSDFVICWTPGGLEQGGTRTAIVFAKENNIPVYNLFNDGVEELIYQHINK